MSRCALSVLFLVCLVVKPGVLNGSPHRYTCVSSGEKRFGCRRRTSRNIVVPERTEPRMKNGGLVIELPCIERRIPVVPAREPGALTMAGKVAHAAARAPSHRRQAEGGAPVSGNYQASSRATRSASGSG